MCHRPKVLVWVDGGYLPKTDEAYCSVRVKGRKDQVFRSDLPLHSCNQAEYGALRFALDEVLVPALECPGLDIEMYSDSQLVVSQVNGEWKIKDPVLQKMSEEVVGLLAVYRSSGVNIALKQSNHDASVAKLGH